MGAAEESMSLTWVVLFATCAVLVQAGACFLEAGIIRAWKGAALAFRNLIDFCVGALLSSAERIRTRRSGLAPTSVDLQTNVGPLTTGVYGTPTRADSEIRTREATATALREAEEKYRSIFENCIEGIFQTTPDGRYLNANPSLARIYGYDTPAELMASIGNIERQLYVDPRRREEFARLIAEQGKVAAFESQVYRRNGDVIWISENATVVHDNADRIVRYEGTVLDISERKRSEQMQSDMERAEAASHAKSAFLARMSHEIRTPLNGINGMLELLAATGMTGQQRRYVRIARASADALLCVINDILDFSKIEAGRLELESIEFDLHLLLEDVVEMFAHRAEARGLELACRIAAEVPRVVTGDPERLRQILINLVGNALKFTEQGSVVLSAAPESNSPQSLLRLEVRDTGIGIPAEGLSRLFSSFSQVDASTTRKYGGSGLGLAICRQLSELMGGTISVASELGKGSAFQVLVPLPAVPEHAASASSVRRRLKGLRALLVDERASSKTVIEEQLMGWGIAVDTLADAHQVPDRLRHAQAAGAPFHVVLLDDRVKSPDPLALIADIGRDNRLKAPTVLLVCSDGHEIPRGTQRDLQIAACLTRPVRPSVLFDALVGSLLAGGDATAALAPERKRAATHGFGGARLLVVDDNDVNQLVTAEMLAAVDCQCDVAANGHEALAAISREAYDLVLMDCEMPEMDGFAATRLLREREANGEFATQRKTRLPVIALTANATCDDQRRCLEAGMDGFITKPVSPEALHSVVGRFLEDSRGPFTDGPAMRVVAGPRLRAGLQDSSSATPLVSVHEESALNLRLLLERCRGDDEFVEMLLAKFRSSAGHEREEIASAVHQNDCEGVRRRAHTLKGAAANVTAASLSHAAGQLEQAAQEGDAAGMRRSLQRLDVDLQRCLKQIEETLATADAVAI